MELFIPSLLAILFAAIIVMFLLPRLSPIVLGIVALLSLGLAARNHYNFFAYEYNQSTWQLPLVNYAPFLLLAGLVIFLIFFMINFIGTSVTEATAPLESINSAINRVADQMPTNITEAVEQVKNVAQNALATVGLAQRNNGNQQKPANIRFSQI